MTLLEQQIEPYRSQYQPSMIEEFIDYWDETVQAGKNKGKARWQLEKTWEVGRRLKRRQRQLAGWAYEKEQRFKLKQVEETPTHREPVAERTDSGFTNIQTLFGKYAR
jgi:hypothetical protein